MGNEVRSGTHVEERAQNLELDFLRAHRVTRQDRAHSRVG